MPRKVEVGVVTGDKMPKTRRVEIARLVRHPKYGKYLRRRTICHVHDENNESQAGDTVEIVESRPMSKTKRWRLVRVVSRGSLIDLAAMRASAKQEEAARREEEAAKPEKEAAEQEEASAKPAEATEQDETQSKDQP